LDPCLDDNKKKLKEIEKQRQRSVKIFFKHMAIVLPRITSDSSSSTLSNMLSMGEDLKDEKEMGCIEYKDHLHHKMIIILFPC
jgi:hypothetical protein